MFFVVLIILENSEWNIRNLKEAFAFFMCQSERRLKLSRKNKIQKVPLYLFVLSLQVLFSSEF